MENAIYYRRSCRSYSSEPLSRAELAEIEDFSKTLVPLDSEIQTAMQIVPGDAVRFYFPWKAPQLIAFFSENKPGYLENAGFLLQQMDLWLQSRGLGVCWLGLGKLKNQVTIPEGMEFVILLAFGTPKETLSKETRKFNRKTMAEISDREDKKLECVRVAPSSTNSQPWYFTHEGETIHAFRSEAGLLRHAMLGIMNRIDMGIALAHLYVENKECFRYFTAEPTQIPAGHCYTGSFTL
jgi:nitroreductase